ncbi:MAG: ligase-associated DNA damage response exonuclease [Chloroflexi bacterium]|nr:ligase-associated DNA damage response exonuclease [Chloroflexota bacterium]
MSRPALLQLSEHGLYCAAGDFHIDPWGSVPRAVITHAHSDHLRAGSAAYLTSREGERLLRACVSGGRVKALPYGEVIDVNGVHVSLHPSGHILGAAQVRVEHHGEVWVVTGDYKTDPDPTCAPFEPLRCHTLITESTFGLPIYRWPAPQQVIDDIHAWWRANQETGKVSVILGYALGKSQRLIASLDPTLGPIYTHGAIERVNAVYRASGVVLPPTQYVSSATERQRRDWSRAMVIAPPSAKATPWLRKFGDTSTAIASGWMRVRGARRRRAVDRGFVMSDHVDWPALMRVVHDSGAQRVLVTHGYNDVVVRWLQEQGLDAHSVETRFEGEGLEGLEGLEHSTEDDDGVAGETGSL